MKKLMGFLMVFALYTIIPMTVFPVKETTKIRQQAKVNAIFSAVEELGQLCVPFIVVFAFCGIAV